MKPLIIVTKGYATTTASYFGPFECYESAEEYIDQQVRNGYSVGEFHVSFVQHPGGEV